MILRDSLGNLIAYKEHGNAIKVSAIQVSPDHRRQGKGTELLNKVKQIGKEVILISDANFDKNTGISQEGLDNFYTVNGFTHLGDGLHMVWRPQ